MYPEVELLDHMIVLFLIFWRTSALFSIVVIQVYIPSKGFVFSTSLPAFVTTCLFDNSHANRYEVISHGLICISLVISYVEHYFMHLLPFECFLWKKSIKNSLYPFKNWVIYLFLLLSCIIFVCFDIGYVICKSFIIP